MSMTTSAASKQTASTIPAASYRAGKAGSGEPLQSRKPGASTSAASRAPETDAAGRAALQKSSSPRVADTSKSSEEAALSMRVVQLEGALRELQGFLVVLPDHPTVKTLFSDKSTTTGASVAVMLSKMDEICKKQLGEKPTATATVKPVLLLINESKGFAAQVQQLFDEITALRTSVKSFLELPLTTSPAQLISSFATIKAEYVRLNDKMPGQVKITNALGQKVFDETAHLDALIEKKAALKGHSIPDEQLMPIVAGLKLQADDIKAKIAATWTRKVRQTTHRDDLAEIWNNARLMLALSTWTMDLINDELSQSPLIRILGAKLTECVANSDELSAKQSSEFTEANAVSGRVGLEHHLDVHQRLEAELRESLAPSKKQAMGLLSSMASRVDAANEVMKEFDRQIYAAHHSGSAAIQAASDTLMHIADSHSTLRDTLVMDWHQLCTINATLKERLSLLRDKFALLPGIIGLHVQLDRCLEGTNEMFHMTPDIFVANAEKNTTNCDSLKGVHAQLANKLDAMKAGVLAKIAELSTPLDEKTFMGDIDWQSIDKDAQNGNIAPALEQANKSRAQLKEDLIDYWQKISISEETLKARIALLETQLELLPSVRDLSKAFRACLRKSDALFASALQITSRNAEKFGDDVRALDAAHKQLIQQFSDRKAGVLEQYKQDTQVRFVSEDFIAGVYSDQHPFAVAQEKVNRNLVQVNQHWQRFRDTLFTAWNESALTKLTLGGQVPYLEQVLELLPKMDVNRNELDEFIARARSARKAGTARPVDEDKNICDWQTRSADVDRIVARVVEEMRTALKITPATFLEVHFTKSADFLIPPADLQTQGKVASFGVALRDAQVQLQSFLAVYQADIVKKTQKLQGEDTREELQATALGKLVAATETGTNLYMGAVSWLRGAKQPATEDVAK